MHYKNEAIIIREFTAQEFPLFLSLFDNTNVTRYLPYKTPEEYKEMFEKAITDYKGDSLNRWGIFNAQDNDFVGMCLARTFFEDPDTIEVGYVLGENYWGKGLGTIVCKALVEHCLSLNNGKDIVAITDLDNIGSQKVLIKSGFNRIENLTREDRELAQFSFQQIK